MRGKNPAHACGQVAGLEFPVLLQILKEKASYEATQSTDNNLGSQVLVLGKAGGRC